MKLIVGLGNPGKKYQETRHNVGFRTLEQLGRRWGDGRVRGQFQGETMDARIDAEKAVLLCPLTYMNKSGQSVLAARDFFKIEHDDLLIICDDFNLPLGKLRLRAKGSSGGQKGLADIIRRLGTEEIPRLRIGIGPPPDGWDVADYVLSKFDKEEEAEMELTLGRAADAVEIWLRDGTETAMNQFN